MLCIILAVSIFCPSETASFMDPYIWQKIKDRGLTAASCCNMSDEEMDAALQQAFDREDSSLCLMLLAGLYNRQTADSYADLLVSLYVNHADTVFKKSVALGVASCVCPVERIARSKFGSMFYDIALLSWSTNESVGDTVIDSYLCLSNLSRNTGFPAWPYAVKKLLFVVPLADSIYAASRCLKMLEREPEMVTPEIAYHILQRYKDAEVFQKYRKAYEAKAGALLSSPTLPEDASLESIRKRVDAAIAENGRMLHEKYGDVTPKPYAPPSEEPQSPPWMGVGKTN